MQLFTLDVLKGKQLVCKHPSILYIAQVVFMENVKKIKNKNKVMFFS